MPHTLQEDNDDSQCQNMVSNLPLLFAAGYPTSLAKITESQLEKFIPFMVQCSLGHIQIQHNFEYSEPEWWPEQVPFSIPLIKPSSYKDRAKWHAKLQEIVVICYSFHKSIFLLRFCNELSMYQPECLRFINNYNSTTSLFHRTSNKLLVTFRNENMLYDQLPIYSKKTLLPKTQNSQSMDSNSERMVEAALFDIYLCDNCEAELYSLDAYKEHEKICLVDDDVIFCEPEDTLIVHQDPIDEAAQRKSMFLLNFNLSNSTQQPAFIFSSSSTATSSYAPQQINSPVKHNQVIGGKDVKMSPAEKLRRLPRRSRAIMVLSKCPNIPISSPAGLQLIKLSKTQMTPEYLSERLDRSERFCHAPLLGGPNVPSNAIMKPKFMERRIHCNNISVSYKRHKKMHYHFYKFPHRQFSRSWYKKAFLYFNSNLLRLCRPLNVRVKQLTDSDIETIKIRNKEKRLARLTKNTTVVDFIDLCSSEDEAEDDSDSDLIECSSVGSTKIVDINDIIMNRLDEIDIIRTKQATNLLDGTFSQMAATPTNPFVNIDIDQNNLLHQNYHQPLQPSVSIFSNVTQTTLSLENHKRMYSNYQNQENNFSFLNGAKTNNLLLNELPASVVMITRNESVASSISDEAITSTTAIAKNIDNNNVHSIASTGTELILKRLSTTTTATTIQQNQISIDLT